jgi:transposase
MFVEELKHYHNNKIYTTLLVRESYRSSGKVRHRTLANITKLPEALVKIIKRFVKNPDAFSVAEHTGTIRFSHNREYGASYTVWQVARSVGLDTLIYSKAEQWREDIMAMIVGRIVYQGSKLHLTNLFADTVLWELAGVGAGVRPEVEAHCYKPLDRLLERQEAIQVGLAKRHLNNGCLILYDLTSVYMEGAYEYSELVAFGKSRDCKRGHEQIAIGLMTDHCGCPVACEVFRGNTADQTTVLSKAKMLAEKFGVEKVIFAGDRGMLTPKRIEEVQELGYSTLTALTHPAIMTLLEKEIIQLDLFDENNIAEVKDPDTPSIRYMLCKNPMTQAREAKTRTALITVTKTKLEKLAATNKRRDDQKLCAAAGAIIGKYKVGKFFTWEVKSHQLRFVIHDAAVNREAALDGCYVVRTTVAESVLTKDEVVHSYRQLMQVEKAFRNLKTVALEIRPVHHHLDSRIKAHVFLCTLAYYVQWHMWQRLTPIMEKAGEESKRRFSFSIILNRLRTIQKQKIHIGDHSVGDIITSPDQEQNEILDALKVKL